ncbi:hypothetical protein CHU98_g4675 [Xylaria longipes]|nr:hypothetical protein CHU98_g4675 [Xylaria longipes]
MQERAKEWSKLNTRSATNETRNSNVSSLSTANDSVGGDTVLRSEEPDTKETPSVGRDSEEEFDLPQLSRSTRSFPSNMDLTPQQSVYIYTDVTSNGPNKGTTNGLYAELLKSRETSQVFSIIVRISPSVNNRIPDEVSHGHKGLGLGPA